MIQEINNTTAGQARHSEREFGEQRQFWWNPDFLALLSQRWQLDCVTSILDVGCGVGHWGRVLATVLPARARLLGVDRESDWVREATHLAEEAGLGGRYQYRRAEAERLPFPESCFDMVTCQTVLIHVADPEVVITEMLRVLRPGGLLALAEPNNRAGQLIDSNVSAQLDLRTSVQRLSFYLTCEHGRRQLGEGYLSVGDLLPGMLKLRGLDDLQVYLSDKTSPLLPPYATPEERALVAELHDTMAQDRSASWGWTTKEAERYWHAGGGDPALFQAQWQRCRSVEEACAESLTSGSFHSAGASVMYLISARKPST